MSVVQLIANRFELHDLLGRGGMGAVYRATDTLTGELVAVKVLDQTSDLIFVQIGIPVIGLTE